MKEVDKIIEIAKAEVGYLEKKTNAMLDDKLANPGSNNYTKYGRDRGCNGQAWCDAFVDWCFIQAFGKQRAEVLLNGFSNYTPTSASYFKQINKWYSKPMVGDIIFFHNSVRICHTGIVYKVDNAYVYTIEGNTSNGTEIIDNGGSVCLKKYALNNSRISGYGRPCYDEEKDKNIMYGIDISSNQGQVNFAKVKSEGVEFIVIRATTKNNNPDTRMAEYVKGCNDNKIPFAFYKYMYATTEEQAKVEATKVIWAIENVGVQKSKDMIIYADVEDKIQFELSEKKLTSVINAFKEVIENSGYTFGLYMSKHPYENGEVSAIEFNDPIWIARYPSNETKRLKEVPSETYKPKSISGYLSGWQWSSRGVINGIQGYVDLDVYYGEIKQVEIKTEYYKTPEWTLVESLNKIGVYSSFDNRKRIAMANGIEGYTGTAEQNLKMLSLLNEGKLIKY